MTPYIYYDAGISVAFTSLVGKTYFVTLRHFIPARAPHTPTQVSITEHSNPLPPIW